MLKIGICDDTPEANQAISLCAAEYFRQKNINVQIDSYLSAESLLKSNKLYDLYLLDVLMPGMTGIEAADIIQKTDINPVIVFITTSLESAVDGYRVNAAGFILKPIEQTFFNETMDRVTEQKLGLTPEYLSVVHNRVPIKIALNRIQYLENKLRKVSIVMSDGEIYTVGQKLSQLQEMLPSQNTFLRCHQSYIVNLNFVEKMEDVCFFMKNGMIVPISRNYYKESKNKYYHYRLE